MIINSDTKISQILKENSQALEAIVRVSPRFEKLRNPLLRKLMAPRTSLAMAAKVGSCSVEDLFGTLEPLGFTIERNGTQQKEPKRTVPEFVLKAKEKDIFELDVRPVIEGGRDPLNLIMEKLKLVKVGQVLKIINSFEPVPLVKLLEKKGYITYVDKIDTDHYETWFFKSVVKDEHERPSVILNDWDAILTEYGDRMEFIDVRHLAMPGPMIQILEKLSTLKADQALYVHHKKIPVFLLPELKEKGFDYRIKEIEENKVDMVIFK